MLYYMFLICILIYKFSSLSLFLLTISQWSLVFFMQNFTQSGFWFFLHGVIYHVLWLPVLPINYKIVTCWALIQLKFGFGAKTHHRWICVLPALQFRILWKLLSVIAPSIWPSRSGKWWSPWDYVTLY